MAFEILTPELQARAEKIKSNYERERSALLPILHLIQNQCGYISQRAEEEVAEYMKIPPVDIKEVITFYSLYRSKPCAKNEFNICRTLSCVIRGADEIVEHVKEKLKIEVGEQTPDGKFELNQVECLGACELAPMAQVNGEYIGPLTKEKIDILLAEAKG